MLSDVKFFKYEQQFRDSLTKTYIDTFSQPPWNEHWESQWVESRVNWIASVPGFSGYVAVIGDEVVAAILGYGMPFRDRLDFEILELFVHPTQQGKDIGKKLVAKLEGQLTAESCAAVYLLTASGTGPEKFYSKLGYGRNEKMCVMTKRLG